MIFKSLFAHGRSALMATVAVTAIASATPASAQFVGRDKGYVGPSYLQVPDLPGEWKADPYPNSVKIDAHYWRYPPTEDQLRRQRVQLLGSDEGAQDGSARAARASSERGQVAEARSEQRSSAGPRNQVFRTPAAPRSGQGTLVLAIDKHNPSLADIMKRCHSGTLMPEVDFSVSADRSRHQEIGPRPAGVPDYLEFRLKEVRFTECPVVDGAPEQAIVVEFAGIEWLNWHDDATMIPVTFHPAQVPPLPNLTGATKAWVVTWIAPAHDVSEEQCPVANARPSEADYYALMSREEAEKERVALIPQGGPNYQTGQMGNRGPNRLSATMLPGIVPDPGFSEPVTKSARGLDLDGGKGPKHREYVSEDGKRSGIDNQLYTVQGCVLGYQGHKGFIMQFSNNQMRDGAYSLLIEVAGIDDEKNDDEVYVTVAYSTDDMAKNAAGNLILPDFTFNVSEQPDFSYPVYPLDPRSEFCH